LDGELMRYVMKSGSDRTHLRRARETMKEIVLVTLAEDAGNSGEALLMLS
jgi:hypothetical protein